MTSRFVEDEFSLCIILYWFKKNRVSEEKKKISFKLNDLDETPTPLVQSYTCLYQIHTTKRINSF